MERRKTSHQQKEVRGVRGSQRSEDCGHNSLNTELNGQKGKPNKNMNIL